MKSPLNRATLGRMLHDLFCEETKTYRRWDLLTPAEQESACRVAEAFCWNAAWPVERPRAFYARVSLMGHRAIGLCRVTEAPLAGVTMLRCEKDGGVEWVNPAAVYSIAEVPDSVAEAEIASALRHAESVRVETETCAVRLRSERASETVEVVVDTARQMTGALAILTGLLRLDDAALRAAFAANDLNGYAFHTLYGGHGDAIGFAARHADSIAERLVAALRSLGFARVNVRDAVDDELVECPF